MEYSLLTAAVHPTITRSCSGVQWSVNELSTLIRVASGRMPANGEFWRISHASSDGLVMTSP